MLIPMTKGGAGGAGGLPPSDKPGADIPPPPTVPPPPGHEWRLQQDPNTKVWGWVIAAVIGAAGSYLSARESNKPRTGYTDQTTTQTPYREDLLESDIEAILNYQRELINQGPSYVGGPNARPQHVAMPGRAPAAVPRADQRLEQARLDLANWQAAGGQRTDGISADRPSHDADNPRPTSPVEPWTPGSQYSKEGAGAASMSVGAAKKPRTFGGWTKDELAEDPSRISKLGTSGGRKYLRYQDRQGGANSDPEMMSALKYLRSLMGNK